MMTWELRLAALGRVIDEAPGGARDLCLLEVEGGFVVQYLVPVGTSDGLTWIKQTQEIADDQILLEWRPELAERLQRQQPRRFGRGLFRGGTAS